MRRILMAAAWGIVVVVLLAASNLALAQDREPAGEPRNGICNPALQFNFPAAGVGATSFNVCLASEGNVVKFIGPAPNDHSLGLEGYRICTPAGDYRDNGGLGQAGFNPAIVSQPNGPNTFPVGITRQTTDGLWLLTQKYSKDNTERDLTITMTLKRQLQAIGAPVYLQRWSDLDVDSTVGGDVGDRSADSIYARQTRAISLTALTFGTAHTTGVGPFPYGAGDCTAPSAATPTVPSDISGRVTYNLGGFIVNQSKTVKFVWRIQ